MFNATRFKTLMLREWLQNRWTWLIATGSLPALVLLVLPFGQVQFPDELPAHHVALTVVCFSAAAAALIAWVTTLFTASGLARRDVQDRSIEFWLSLPSTHSEHVGAQYLMHAWVFPIGALLLGLVAGNVLTPLMLVKWQGFAVLASIDWASVVRIVLVFVGIALVAMTALALWLSPVLLTIMAASAWVKRLALPLLVVAGALLANLPMTQGPVRAFVGRWAELAGTPVDGVFRVVATLAVPQHEWERLALPPKEAGSFFVELARDLATPQFVASLMVAALGAALIIAKRRRNG